VAEKKKWAAKCCPFPLFFEKKRGEEMEMGKNMLMQDTSIVQRHYYA
jgi:hypothetical protein